jgi:hypothetical protein
MKAINVLSVMLSLAVVTLFGAPLSYAQDKAKDAKTAPAAKVEKGEPTDRVLVDNEKVRVIERTYKPGDVNTRPENQVAYRTNYTAKGGTLERTYADGKKQKMELKAGTLRYLEPTKAPGGQWTTKNIGNTDVVSIITVLK